MKTSVKLFLLIISLAFCSITGHAKAPSFSNFNTQLESIQKKTEKSSISSVNYLNNNTDFERIVTYTQTVTPQVHPIDFGDAHLFLNYSEHVTQLQHTKYLQHLRNTFLSFLTTDMIYPFHTFW
ncbi:hypothetical protein [Lacinutrix undariae]